MISLIVVINLLHRFVMFDVCMFVERPLMDFRDRSVKWFSVGKKET